VVGCAQSYQSQTAIAAIIPLLTVGFFVTGNGPILSRPHFQLMTKNPTVRSGLTILFLTAIVFNILVEYRQSKQNFHRKCEHRVLNAYFRARLLSHPAFAIRPTPRCPRSFRLCARAPVCRPTRSNAPPRPVAVARRRRAAAAMPRPQIQAITAVKIRIRVRIRIEAKIRAQTRGWQCSGDQSFSPRRHRTNSRSRRSRRSRAPRRADQSSR
jgi:hypothetical protein